MPYIAFIKVKPSYIPILRFLSSLLLISSLSLLTACGGSSGGSTTETENSATSTTADDTILAGITQCTTDVSSTAKLAPIQEINQSFAVGNKLVSAMGANTEIAPILTIPAAHQGKEARLYALSIDDRNGKLYIRNASGWTPLTGGLDTYKTVTLGQTLTMDLVSGNFCAFSGRIFYGYNLVDESDVYHGNGISLVVSETAKKLQTLLNNIAADDTTYGKIPGVLFGVEIPGEGRWYGASGVTNLSSNDEAMQPDYLFRMGSINKTFTGAAILSLVDEGKLKLDDTLGSILPNLGVKHADTMQIKHMLAHTSGVADYAFHDDWWQALMLQEDSRIFTPTELIGLANQMQIVFENNFQADVLPELGIFEPGSLGSDGTPHLHYSNTNFGLLGMIIEKVTGNRYEDEVYNRILKPFGLSKTLFPLNNDADMPEHSATGHNNWIQQGLPLSDSLTLSVAPIQTCNGSPCEDTLLPQPSVESSFSWAIGNGITNTEDLMDWITALVKRKVFTYATEEQAFSFLALDATNNVGLGIARYYDNLIGHRGQLPGFDAVMEYDMDLDIPLVAVINRSFWPDATGEIKNVNEIVVLPAREIINQQAAALQNAPQQRRVPVTLPDILQQKVVEYYTF